MLLFSPSDAKNPGEGNSEWRWRRIDGQGGIQSGEINPDGLSGFAQSHASWFEAPRRVVLVLPSDEVLHLSVELPGRSVSSIRQALPFALEEFITSDVENVHIAHHAIRPGQPVACAVIETQRLEAWLTLFSAAQIKLGAVISEAQLIRPDSGAGTLLFDEDQVLLVTENQDALIDRDALPAILEGLELKELVCVGDQLTDVEAGQLSSPPEVFHVPGETLDYLADQLGKAGEGFTANPMILNLLQGRFAVRFDDKGHSARWRQTLTLAALWFGVAAGALSIQGLWLEHQADQQDQDNFATYIGLFPNDSVPVTTTQLQRRFASKLGRSSDADDGYSMVDLLLRTSSVLGPDSDLQSVRFRAKQMELSADVLIAGFDELDNIKGRSQSVGISVEVSDASAEQDRVRARLIGTYQ